MKLWFVCQRVIAFVALIALLPLLALLWCLVKGTSKGPFLYSQMRPGLGGVPMRTWKIRTMTPGADRNQALARCVTKDCAEVTSVGRILRQLKLDELPQLWNIVRGEMAFVGPRPIAGALFSDLCEQIPGFHDRTLVRPGLSNVAQVAIEDNAEGEQLLHDWRERFEAERHYLARQSAGYDVIVISLTLLYVGRKTWKLFARCVVQIGRKILQCNTVRRVSRLQGSTPSHHHEPVKNEPAKIQRQRVVGAARADSSKGDSTSDLQNVVRPTSLESTNPRPGCTV